ncbi:uncharacterized protein MELLADRAFT_61504 [Melampsora larici-populina 98AG31]|uniref:Uncharacterized protein n=1 Tax=Melampsora larici-populina (strain 98AG31 / pathotype 3-4-7) TaxID=747676 RepID=F4RF68_MELLP|nr:uncharacterized protein MELLADRAFT_61504 [Melampsora larici-populina 98AG31]EGG08987.1 hypothetical protein MELLADRAFT_61504 [Melampsora larici-populina 98AG31]
MSDQFSSINSALRNPKFLNILYSKSDQDISDLLVLLYKNGQYANVEQFGNVVYQFYNQGTLDAYCTLSLLEFVYVPFFIPSYDQLLIMEYQKRGVPHAHSTNVIIKDEARISLKDLQGLTSV